jgi:hypothetical protein
MTASDQENDHTIMDNGWLKALGYSRIRRLSKEQRIQILDRMLEIDPLEGYSLIRRTYDVVKLRDK